MLNKILNSFALTKQKTTKNLVNIASESNSIKKSEEFKILQEAKGVIENFARKNNLQVDLFFKEANNNVEEKMLDVKVKNYKNNASEKTTFVYKKDDKPVNFIVKKPNIRYVQPENREYTQSIKPKPIQITVHNCEENKISRHEVEFPEIKVHITEYNNYEIPQKVGEGEYEDSFLRHVYRAVEKLGKFCQKNK